MANILSLLCALAAMAGAFAFAVQGGDRVSFVEPQAAAPAAAPAPGAPVLPA